MKKLVFPIVVALVATFALVSCGETPLTDEELKVNIKSNVTYTGTEGVGVAAMNATLQISAMNYTLSYDELGVFSAGIWDVLSGGMILTGGPDPTVPGTNYPSGIGVITKKGNELELSFGTLVFKLKKK